MKNKLFYLVLSVFLFACNVSAENSPNTNTVEVGNHNVVISLDGGVTHGSSLLQGANGDVKIDNTLEITAKRSQQYPSGAYYGAYLPAIFDVNNNDVVDFIYSKNKTWVIPSNYLIMPLYISDSQDSIQLYSFWLYQLINMTLRTYPSAKITSINDVSLIMIGFITSPMPLLGNAYNETSSSVFWLRRTDNGYIQIGVKCSEEEMSCKVTDSSMRSYFLAPFDQVSI
jgi:hypothetical protein